MPFNCDPENETTVIDFGKGDVCVGGRVTERSLAVGTTKNIFPYPLSDDATATLSLSDIGQTCCIGTNIRDNSGIPPTGVTDDRCVTLNFPISVEGMHSARVVLNTMLFIIDNISREMKAKAGISYVPASDKCLDKCIFCHTTESLYHVRDLFVCPNCVADMHSFTTNQEVYQEYLNNVDDYTRAQHDLHNLFKETEMKRANNTLEEGQDEEVSQ